MMALLGIDVAAIWPTGPSNKFRGRKRVIPKTAQALSVSF